MGRYEIETRGVHVSTYEGEHLRVDATDKERYVTVHFDDLLNAAGLSPIDHAIETAFDTDLEKMAVWQDDWEDVERKPEWEADHREYAREYLERRATYARESGRACPPVYRVKIIVETEPLTDAESEAWWAARRDRG